jgi:hypothetical protein
VGFGAAFALLTPGMCKENEVVAHIVVLLTLVLTFALVFPLRGALTRDDVIATLRVTIMLLSCVVALIVYIRSFIEARRSR